jgi:hypothetical protein
MLRVYKLLDTPCMALLPSCWPTYECINFWMLTVQLCCECTDFWILTVQHCRPAVDLYLHIHLSAAVSQFAVPLNIDYNNYTGTTSSKLMPMLPKFLIFSFLLKFFVEFLTFSEETFFFSHQSQQFSNNIKIQFNLGY